MRHPCDMRGAPSHDKEDVVVFVCTDGVAPSISVSDLLTLNLPKQTFVIRSEE